MKHIMQLTIQEMKMMKHLGRDFLSGCTYTKEQLYMIYHGFINLSLCGYRVTLESRDEFKSDKTAYARKTYLWEEAEFIILDVMGPACNLYVRFECLTMLHTPFTTSLKNKKESQEKSSQ
ncbi:hypothetical protein ACJX0J_033337, partial [Zea mays]